MSSTSKNTAQLGICRARWVTHNVLHIPNIHRDPAHGIDLSILTDDAVHEMASRVSRMLISRQELDTDAPVPQVAATISLSPLVTDSPLNCCVFGNDVWINNLENQLAAFGYARNFVAIVSDQCQGIAGVNLDIDFGKLH